MNTQVEGIPKLVPIRVVFYNFCLTDEVDLLDWQTVKSDMDRLVEAGELPSLGVSTTASAGDLQELLGLSAGVKFKTVHLNVETKYLFDNQFNAIGENVDSRLYDRCYIYPNLKNYRCGYYVQNIADLNAVRVLISKCGYCQAQYRTGSKRVCTACLGSQHLRKENLHLLALAPIGGERLKLAEKELKALEKAYDEAQQGTASALRHQYVLNQLEYCEKKVKETQQKAEIALWLWEAGFPVSLMENAIWYDHLKVLSFGWRNNYPHGVKFTEEEKAMIAEKCKTCPVDWQIKEG